MNNRDRIVEIIKRLKKEYPNAKYYLKFSNPLELMVAAILSAQVRDEIVNSTTEKLFKKYKRVEDYAAADLKDLQNDIKAVTFYVNKAKNIKEACKMLIEDYQGKVPDNLDDLIKLPGIGRKTANAILINAYNKVVGIPCDTHVLRLSYRLGLTKSKNPEKVEMDLMTLIPKQYWKELPWLLKDHGRAICKAPVPFCSKCILNDICPKIGVNKKL